MKGVRRQRRAAADPASQGALRLPQVPVEALGPVVRELVGQLWESEQRHRLAFEQSTVGMAYAALDGRFVCANDSWCALTGWSRGELESLALDDLADPEDHERHVRLRRELLTGRIASYALETRRTRGDGCEIWLQFQVAIGRAAYGEPIYLLSSVQDITAIKLAQQERALAQASYAVERAALEHARDEARQEARVLAQSNAALEQFLAVASHELLTPLTIIQASTQLLARRARRAAPSDGTQPRAGIPQRAGRESAYSEAAAAQRDLLARVEAQVHALSRVLDDMVQVARMGTGSLELCVERVDLVALVERVVAAQRVACGNRIILLDAPADEPILVLADADHIAQVVTNYLTNALKYSPPDRPVRVSVSVSAHRATLPDDGHGNHLRTGDQTLPVRAVRVAVRDEGVGIAADEQSRVWERFHRVPGVRAHMRSGANLGLGLHICQSIIARHDGAVGLSSVPGEGSTFWFHLPLAPAAPD